MFELKGRPLLLVTAVELLAGLAKTSFVRKRNKALKCTQLIIFAMLETACCIAIAVSIGHQLRLLKYRLSTVIYILAIVVDFLALVFDIISATTTFVSPELEGAPWWWPLRSAMNALVVSLPTVGVSIAVFGRLEWDARAVRVVDLGGNSAQSLAARLALGTLGCLLAGSMVLIATNIYVAVYETLNGGLNEGGLWFMSLIQVIGSITSLMIVCAVLSVAALSSSLSAAGGYTFVAVTVIPPLFALATTAFKSLYSGYYKDDKYSELDWNDKWKKYLIG